VAFSQEVQLAQSRDFLARVARLERAFRGLLRSPPPHLSRSEVVEAFRWSLLQASLALAKGWSQEGQLVFRLDTPSQVTDALQDSIPTSLHIQPSQGLLRRDLDA